MYRDILENELPALLENLSLEVRQNMLFQHGGCPEYYSMVVREVLDRNFNGHCTARAGPVNGLADYQILVRQISFLFFSEDKVYK